MRILGDSLCHVNENPKNFLLHGRSTALFCTFTFNLSVPSINLAIFAIVLNPARLERVYMLQSSAYRTKSNPLDSSSLSNSSRTMLDNKGLKGPPWGVPSVFGCTSPCSITPACK